MHASDLSQEAIEKNRGKIPGNGDAAGGACNRLSFTICNCADAADVQKIIREARLDGGNIAVYNRFFLHSLDQAQEQLFLVALQAGLVSGDRLFMEFRCSLDEELPKVHGTDHYRRYVDTSNLLFLLDRAGFDIEYEISGQGMAKYKSEDPFVSRIIANRR